MDFQATCRYARGSARKARLVADLIRGKQVDDALETLMFIHRKPKVMVEKLLKSAIANVNEYVNRVKNNPELFPKANMEKIDTLLSDGVEGHLRIKKVFVDGGPVMKRWLPRAMGRATPLLKRSCHITLVLSDGN